ncbi:MULTISPECIES: Rieske (2Fe-2S) protein [unclassified Corynebacterium]|uniref:Rieske (2Fe-2S) protein n=1 Tax=unclassified Corynebacterium TaxID=2624378 RepID=UPI0029CAA41F|nr:MULTISPECIES: Rieske 2Fe-2S domain-containing protein [unclassified Corynebacterium]WPF66141.1 Rieske 2Fe-2S domain-containing protein [Corynebacterium sp. 22KM0430]WPF68634.1 Rieske 2Fe-2S domain-containing protein [Corynebacterium sp. 21KM1197]
MVESQLPPCSRRLFLLGSATTFAGAVLAACGSGPSEEIAATDVPVGSAVIVGDFIIAQTQQGQYRAYSTTCPHQSSKITEVEGETVRCTAHNSVFSLSDGSVVEGPARAPLTEGSVEEKGANLSVSL